MTMVMVIPTTVLLPRIYLELVVPEWFTRQMTYIKVRLTFTPVTKPNLMLKITFKTLGNTAVSEVTYSGQPI